MSLAVEGAATADSLLNATSATINITTSGTNRIIILHATLEGGTARTVSGVSASGLTFNKRSAVAAGDVYNVDVEVWWAYAAAQQTGTTITVNFSGTVDCATLGTFAVSGVKNFNNPWSNDATLPVTNSTAAPSTTIDVTGVTATEINVLVLGFYGASTNYTIGYGTGYTTIYFHYNNNGTHYSDIFAEYQLFTTAQTNITVDTTGGPQSRWGMIADAITDAATTLRYGFGQVYG